MRGFEGRVLLYRCKKYYLLTPQTCLGMVVATHGDEICVLS